MSEREPDIVINGRTLSRAEAMTVRVALESFASDMEERGLGEDAIGVRICEGYKANLRTIRSVLYAHSPRS